MWNLNLICFLTSTNPPNKYLITFAPFSKHLPYQIMSTWMVVLSLALLFRGWSFSILFLFYLSARSLRGPWFFWLYSYCPIRVPTQSLNVQKNSFITFLSPWILQRLWALMLLVPNYSRSVLSHYVHLCIIFFKCVSLLAASQWMESSSHHPNSEI